jgi:hypothetical protein
LYTFPTLFVIWNVVMVRLYIRHYLPIVKSTAKYLEQLIRT